MGKVRTARVRRTPVTPPDVVLRRLEENMVELAVLRKQVTDLVRQIDGDEVSAGVQTNVVTAMKALGLKKHRYTGPSGVEYNATLGQSTSRTINEEKLKRKVGPGIWRKITTLMLDKKKAEAAIASGLIDPVDYADCIEVTPGAEFAKVTMR